MLISPARPICLGAVRIERPNCIHLKLSASTPERVWPRPTSSVCGLHRQPPFDPGNGRERQEIEFSDRTAAATCLLSRRTQHLDACCAERQTNAGLIGLAGRHIRHDTVQTDAWLHLRLTINTVLSSMRSSSLICCRYSSCFTACSRIALQISFAGSSLCSRITRSICSRSCSSLPS